MALVISVGSLPMGCQIGGQMPSPTPASTAPVALTPTQSPSRIRPAAPPTSLKVTGALSAATDPSAGENACFFGQPFPGQVRLTTPEMPLSDGQVIGVTMFISPSLGTSPAASPTGDGRARVRIQRHTRPAGGADSGDWFATSGTLTVTDSEHVGDPTQYGVISGSVEAHLTLPDSTLPLDLGGTWGCVIESTANAS